jgi:sRNA-binding protein
MAKYNESVAEGANRVDLDGKAVSTISANDAGFAKAKLKSILVARNRNNSTNTKNTKAETSATTPVKSTG